MIFLKLFESKMREIQTTANGLNLKKREIKTIKGNVINIW